jgi:hypothetical protein
VLAVRRRRVSYADRCMEHVRAGTCPVGTLPPSDELELPSHHTEFYSIGVCGHGPSCRILIDDSPIPIEYLEA